MVPVAATAPPAPPAMIVQRKAECPICFDPLVDDAVCRMMNTQQRSCGHYIHTRCCIQFTQCPMCRAPFTSVADMPSIEDPGAWFAAVDSDGNGWLSRLEVLSALRATCDVEDLEISESLWRQWDANGDGRITFEEIFRPQGGLLAYVHRFQRNRLVDPPPFEDRYRWFQFWDENRTNSLDRSEVHRALVKTFDLARDLARIQTMADTLATVWCLFDDDGDGTISFDEFVRPDGFAATLSANLSLVPQRPQAQPQAQPQPQVVTPQGHAPQPPRPPPPAYAGLPPGWELVFTPDGRPYYVNRTTRATQWSPPGE